MKYITITVLFWGLFNIHAADSNIVPPDQNAIQVIEFNLEEFRALNISDFIPDFKKKNILNEDKFNEYKLFLEQHWNNFRRSIDIIYSFRKILDLNDPEILGKYKELCKKYGINTDWIGIDLMVELNDFD